MKENEREAQIQRALKALESGKYTTLGEAAIAFKVPKSTLGHRRTGRQTRRKAHEKEQLLSAATEEAIVKWILKLDNWCDGCVPRARSLWHALAGFADKPLARTLGSISRCRTRARGTKDSDQISEDSTKRT